ncbi:MerR family transcriptional regulator [Streptomyces zingiberis]|uniref:MerR family transcriptional regulator n=1 Tax=Streptomyces zingiberis TaxID=2053010 RepID=A0ABX1BVB3_9ACTN|nr:MerR family transcriptional regulator [Streptomyces zingiberis]NJP99691.1 MerR family transcriptional regulator [Streptomyces zingiberis]
MRIGELARRAGVSVRSLRYYEQQGLLDPERTAGGQRVYEEGAVERVHLIQQLFAAGLPSRTIIDLLPCVSTGVATAGMFDTIRHERAAIERRIAELTAARDKLDGVIECVLRAGIHQEPSPHAAG